MDAIGAPSLERMHRALRAQTGWRRALVAISAGAVSALGFAPIFLSPVLFLTLPVLVWLMDESAGPRQAAVVGWLFGFGYFFASLFWVGEAFLVEAEKFAALMPFAITLLPAGLAVFWAAATGLARMYWRPGIARILTLAAALAIAEWLRGHVLTGFPWNVLGYALTAPLALMQSAALVGVYALTVPAVLIFASPLVLLGDGRRYFPALAWAAIPLAALALYGGLRLATSAHDNVPGVMLRIVQPSVPQREKWMPEFQRRIFQDHLDLSRTDPSGHKDDLAGITHVIWPEAAMPFLPLEHPEALSAIADLLPEGRVLITGALRLAKPPPDAGSVAGTSPRQGFNSLMVFADDGALAAVYDKIHLVPFGEYIPVEPLLARLGLTALAHGHGSFIAGPTPRPLLNVPGLPPVDGLICYEALFPGAVVQGPKRPGVLINVTNDGWFGSSTGPPAHFHQTRVRAVEEGLPLVRAANNGISGVVDPYGRIVGYLELNAKGVIDSPLPAALPGTPFSHIGDLGLVLLILGAGALAAWSSRQAR